MRILLSRLSVAAIILSIGVVVSVSLVALAFTKEDITFPIAELDNCVDKASCRTYCDEPEHADACLTFAEKHNLIPRDEVEHMRRFMEIGEGPGGCNSPQACEVYCDDVTNINECLAFAEEHDLISEEELEEARKVQAALAQGAQLPGGCTNKTSCEVYCEDPAHIEECIAFAEVVGFIPPEELAEARQVLVAIKKGAVPPPCRGEAECDVYCQEPENIEQCITFAEAAGFMSSKEAAMVRRTGGRGPGGCRGRECEAFCEEPVNQEICFAFAKEYRLIPEGELQEIEKNMQQFRQMLAEAPPEFVDCLSGRLGADVVAGIREGGIPSGDIREDIETCFSEVGSPTDFGEPGHEGPTDRPPQMSDEVRRCIAERLGVDVANQTMRSAMPPSPRLNEAIKYCKDKIESQREDHPIIPNEGVGIPSLFQGFPNIILDCVKSAIGPESFDAIRSGRVFPPPNIRGVIESCFGQIPMMQQILPSPDQVYPPKEEFEPPFEKPDDFFEEEHQQESRLLIRPFASILLFVQDVFGLGG